MGSMLHAVGPGKLRRFLVRIGQLVERGQQRLLLGQAQAVVHAELRLDDLCGLAVAAVQEAVCRSNTGGVGRL